MSLCFSVFSCTWSSPGVIVLSRSARRFLQARAPCQGPDYMLCLHFGPHRLNYEGVLCFGKVILVSNSSLYLLQAECPLGTTTESKSSWGFLTSWQSEIALLLILLLTQRWASESRMQFTVIVYLTAA